MSKHIRKVLGLLQHRKQIPPSHQQPTSRTPEEWSTYWTAQGQPWRTEPEIDKKRQEYLAERRTIKPDIEQGIYPFKDIQLSRADVEWLLATHEERHGPVDWGGEHQGGRTGVDLRGADLGGVDLSHLPLARMLGGLGWKEWPSRTQEQRDTAAVLLEKANLSGTRLQGAELNWAQLKGTDLFEAHLEDANLQGCHLEGARLYRAQLRGAHLFKARLKGADLSWAHLEEADLGWAYLAGANLKGACLEGADLEQVRVGDENHVGPRLVDTNWGNVNLAVVEWSQIQLLGDEYEARQRTHDGKLKDKAEWLSEYQVAVRANRQLATVLQGQVLDEDAARFAYRAQKLQRIVLRRERKFGQYLFSLFLDGVAGYGYRPQRCFILYFLALLGFTLAHYILGVVAGPPLTFLNALAVSVQSLHGRIFSFQSGDPQMLLNTIEAFVGLFIEAIVVAVITQRILGK